MNAIEKGELAKRFLSEDVVTDAFNKVRDAFVNTAMKCDKTDDRGRYLALEAARTVDLVHALLANAIKTGEIEKKQAQSVTGVSHIWADGVSRATKQARQRVVND